MTNSNTSTSKSPQDLVDQTRAFWQELEDDQHRRWQRRNGSLPRWPLKLANLSRVELEHLFSLNQTAQIPRKLKVETPPAQTPNFLAKIKHKYEQELAEPELPAPKQVRKELETGGVKVEEVNPYSFSK